MLENLPRSMAQFEQLFHDESACVAIVRKCRWPNGFRCPRCGCGEAWELKTRPLDECRACGRQVSLTAGTVFARTRKPLRLWFRVFADVLLDKRGCSALDVARRHGITYRTAWTWLHKMRSLMPRDGVRPLSDRVEAVCLDIPRPQRSVRWPIVAVEKAKGGGCGRLRVTRGTSQEELAQFVTRNCAPLTMVKTRTLAAHCEEELRKAHLVPFTAPNPDVPAADCVYTHLRRQLLGTYHGAISRRHALRYLDEFVFRFNRRTSKNRWLLVRRLLESCARRVPTYRQLATPA